VVSIDPLPLPASGNASILIDIEEGSILFRIQDELLGHFGVRSVVDVIGSPDSIAILSSIEGLLAFCCFEERLRTVEIEADSKFRLIYREAFREGNSFESICSLSSVEIIRLTCFLSRSGLQAACSAAIRSCRLLKATSSAHRWNWFLFQHRSKPSVARGRSLLSLSREYSLRFCSC
jgi:hypothetical protein